jgi:uncharacterized repeat protein (TIGR01451 family)
MKRSLWMIAALVAGIVGLIAVARAQKSLQSFEHDPGVAAAQSDDSATDQALSDDDPWSDTLVAGPAPDGFGDQYALQEGGNEEAQSLEGGEGVTIPPGPGLDFRRFGDEQRHADDESSGTLPEGEYAGTDPAEVGSNDESASIEEPTGSPELLAPQGTHGGAGDSDAEEPSLFDFPSGDDAIASPEVAEDPLLGEQPTHAAEPTVEPAGAISEAEPAAAPDPSTLGPQTPTITLEKIAPAMVRMGEPLHYEIVVRNDSATPAYGVVVRDPVPNAAELISTEPEAETRQGELVWSLGTLESHEERRLAVQLQPTREGDIGSVAEVTFSARAAARTLVAQPKLALELVADAEQILMGESVTLNFRVSNPGTGTATGVVLIEPIPEPLEHPAGAELEYEIGTLEPGQTREVPLTLKATRGGRAVNQAKVVADGDLEATATTELHIAAPQLSVSVTGPRRRYLGREASFTVAVVNPGEVPATGVRIVSHVPDGMQFVEAGSGGRFDPQTRTISWSLAELGGSQSAHLHVALLPTSAGQKLHRVQATAEQGLEAESQLTTSVEGISAVLLEVVDVDDPVEVGTETAYEVRIVSQGSKSSTNVRLIAEVAPGIEILGSDGPTAGEVHEGKIVFEPLAQLGPGVDAVYRIRAKGTRAGDQRFKVALTTDQMPNPVREEESTRVYAD